MGGFTLIAVFFGENILNMYNHIKAARRIAGRVFLFAALFYTGEFLLFNLMSARISSTGRKVLNQMYMSNPIEIFFFFWGGIADSVWHRL